MEKELEKPEVVERYSDNVEHSHWDLIDVETGKLLWSEEDKEWEELSKRKFINRLKEIETIIDELEITENNKTDIYEITNDLMCTIKKMILIKGY